MRTAEGTCAEGDAVDDLEYLAEHPFEYADADMKLSMEVCPTCAALQEPHVRVRLELSDQPGKEADRREFATVTHALNALLHFACKLSEKDYRSIWDLVYSVAAWRMMLPGVVTLPPSQAPKAH